MTRTVNLLIVFAALVGVCTHGALQYAGSGGLNELARLDVADSNLPVNRPALSNVAAQEAVGLSAAAPVAPRKIQMSEISSDGPTWLQANKPLYYTWVHPGGDWRDRQNVAQGDKPYASATTSTIAEQSITISNLGPLVKQLIADNTGFYIRQPNGGTPAKIASKDNKNGKPIPALTVVTDQGTFHPKLTHDVHLDASTDQCLGTGEYLATPFLLKFELAAVKGNVQSASLKVYLTDIYPNNIPLALTADYLDMPALITSPATQIGKPAAGLRGTVGEVQLSKHPSVIIYSAMNAKTTPTEWINYGGSTNIYKTWPEYGVGAVRVEGRPQNGPSIISWRHWAQPIQPGKSYSRDYNKGYDELWLSYTLMIDPDVKDGMNERGVKLPGLGGGYDNVGQPNYKGAYNSSLWSGRMEHSNLSPSHPHVYRLLWYWYGADHPVYSPQRGAILTTDVSLLAGRIYSIEQHIKLNTFNAQTQKWNHDGVREVFVDGVRVFHDPKSYIRNASIIQIQDIPFLNVYHGGNNAPGAPIHYELGPVVVATQYVGPLKKALPASASRDRAPHLPSTATPLKNRAL